VRRIWITSASFAFVVGFAQSALGLPPLPASIRLTKTVGTSPGCATTDSITVPAGTQVFYCYEVGNTGAFAFLTHTLVDDQFGVLFGPAASLPLAPGQEFQVFFQTPINVDTTNRATWTAQGGVGAPELVFTRTATDRATVTVTEMGPSGCSDEIDNDEDMLVDCVDPECEGEAVCVAPAPTLGTGALIFSALLLLGIGGLGLTARRRA
jgi:hypothetical protein